MLPALLFLLAAYQTMAETTTAAAATPAPSTTACYLDYTTVCFWGMWLGIAAGVIILAIVAYMLYKRRKATQAAREANPPLLSPQPDGTGTRLFAYHRQSQRPMIFTPIDMASHQSFYYEPLRMPV